MTYRAADVAAVYVANFSTSPRHSTFTGDHWLPQPTEPTTEAVVSALTGEGAPISFYFLGDDSTTHVGAIDVDTEDGWTAIEAITTVLLDAGVQCYPEHSRRGGHLWIAADRRLPAIVFRFAIMAAIEQARLDPSDPHLEVRPSTDRRTSDYAGGALRGPWMRHPATGERYGLLDPRTMRPLHAKVAGALLDFEQADHRAIGALAERYVPRIVAAPRSVPNRHREQGSVTAALERGWGVLTTPGRSIKCPLHDDQHPSLKVAPDDLRAWCWSPSCVLNENGRGVTAWRLEQLAAGAAA